MNIIKVNELPQHDFTNKTFEILPDKKKVVEDTHRLFNKYPTRYIPQIPRWAIQKHSKENSVILDPFSGSGTTLVESVKMKRRGFAVDVDPFARLLTKVKTTVFSEADFDQLDHIVNSIRENFEDHRPEIMIPEIPNIQKWFKNEISEDLNKIKSLIITYTLGNEKIRDYLLIVFAGIIRRVSNAENQSPKPYISSRFKKDPEDPYELFFKMEVLYRNSLLQFSKKLKFDCNHSDLIGIVGDDAREFNLGTKIDLAVTSPPYVNAYDYVRILKFENMWLGLAENEALVKMRRNYVGTESLGERKKEMLSALNDCKFMYREPVLEVLEQDATRAAIIMAYFDDMKSNMQAVSESLDEDGRYVIVVGDSTIRDVQIPTSDILIEIGESLGFQLESRFRYVIRDRYLHLPRQGRGGIIKYDHVITLKK